MESRYASTYRFLLLRGRCKVLMHSVIRVHAILTDVSTSDIILISSCRPQLNQTIPISCDRRQYCPDQTWVV